MKSTVFYIIQRFKVPFRLKNISLPIKFLKIAQIMRFSWKIERILCQNSYIFIMLKKTHISIPIFQFRPSKNIHDRSTSISNAKNELETPNNALQKKRLPFEKAHFTHEPRTQKNIESIYMVLVSTLTRTANTHTTFTALYVYIYWYIYAISVFCLTMLTNTYYIKKYVNPWFATRF